MGPLSALPNQGEVSQIQPRRPGKRDCVGGGAGSLTQAVLHRVDFPFWVCHYVIIMSRNKRAPQVGSMPCLARLVERRSPARSGLGFLYSLRSCEKQTRNLNYYCGQPCYGSFSQSYSTNVF